MAINKTILTEAIRRMGPAEIFVGDPLVAVADPNHMVSLGMLEGERRGEIEYSDNALTMPEYTGDVPHDITSAVSAARIIGSIVLNAAGVDIWEKINPLGSNAGGSSSFTRKPTMGVLLVPHSELGKSLVYDTSEGMWKRTEDDDTVTAEPDSDPVHALWLWKAHVKHGSIPYSFDNGGKSLVEVTFEGMFDPTKPEGAKVFLIGDPYAFSTPIPVLPQA